MVTERILGDAALALQFWEIPGTFFLLCITNTPLTLRILHWKKISSVMISKRVTDQYTTQGGEKSEEETDFICKLIPILNIIYNALLAILLGALNISFL